jgi:hypothetical protein
MAARKGEAHHKAKLTDDLVREVRRLRRTEGLSIQRLCEHIGWLVGVHTMESVIQRRTWKHVEDD